MAPFVRSPLGHFLLCLGLATACSPAPRPADLPVPEYDGGSVDAASPDAGVADSGGEPHVWQDVEATVCGVRGKMLGTPKETSRMVSTESGPAKLTMLMYEAQGGQHAMGIMCSDGPALKTTKATNEHVLDGSRDGMVRNVRGTLVREAPMTIAGFPGREVVIQTKTQQVFARMIFIRKQGRIITLIAVGLDEAEARSFLDGAVLEAKAK